MTTLSLATDVDPENSCGKSPSDRSSDEGDRKKFSNETLKFYFKWQKPLDTISCISAFEGVVLNFFESRGSCSHLGTNQSECVSPSRLCFICQHVSSPRGLRHFRDSRDEISMCAAFDLTSAMATLISNGELGKM